MRIRRIWSGVGAVVLLLALFAPQASAGPTLKLTLHDDLDASPVPARARVVTAGKESCWYNQDLTSSPSKVAIPGSKITYNTEKKNKFLTSCYNGPAERGIAIQIDEPGPGWRTPTGLDSNYRIYFNSTKSDTFGFNFLSGIPTWLPRTDGNGLLCVDTYTYTQKKNNTSSKGFADLRVRGDDRCNRAVPASTAPDKTRYRAEARPSGVNEAHTAASKEAPLIVDLLSSVQIACEWYASPNNKAFCNNLDVGNQANWTVDNVSNDVKEFRVTDSIGMNNPKAQVGTARVSIPPTSPGGSVSVDKSVTTSESSSTSSTFGWGLGQAIGFKQSGKLKLPFVAEGGVEFSQEFSASQDWSNTNSTDVSKSQSRQVSISVGAAPGYTTTLDVFTTERDAHYDLAADLEFGDAGTAEPVVTPGPKALGMSPATRHPCLPYVVGDETVRNSITNIGKALTDAGNSPTEPTLSAERRAFLRSIPGYTIDATPCPGFPDGFASQAAFAGRGVGTYENLGYDEQGNPVSVMVGCVYQTPFGQGASASAARKVAGDAGASGGSPCQSVPVSNGKVTTTTPGTLIEAGGTRTQGSEASEKVVGSERNEKISAGAGVFDQVHAQGGHDSVNAGAGEDLVEGGAGKDEIDGGPGFDTVHGGDGRDKLRDSGGAGTLSGDGADDKLVATGASGLTMLGGDGDDTLVAEDGSTTMDGGPGDDQYVLISPDGEIFELPDAGTDVVKTDHNLRVPPAIEKAIATGHRHVKLQSTTGHQVLVGNRAQNVLEGGADSDRIRGGKRADRIVMDEFGFDRATGGKGADRFAPKGSPSNASRPAGLNLPRNRDAHLITDFNPGEGDRVVLRASVFGKSLARRRVPIVRARKPRPKHRRGTLLFDRRNGVLSFDRDGTGPISDKVAVLLPHTKKLKRRWLNIRG